MEGLRDIIQDSGQIWIATHSISLVSNLKYEELYIVKNNTIYPPSRNNPTETANQLMGIQQHIYNLATFMSSTKDWAYVNFMTQCLLDPDVVDTANKNDPQLEVFMTSINRGNSIVLDFGAGTGRMYKALLELDAFNVIINEYHALEIESKSREVLKNMGIKNIYSESSKLPENRFDYVLICNVLHEVPLSNWIATINRLVKSLKPTGHIVLVEVNELPVGEKIDEAGFLVLDPPSVKSLFGLENDPVQIFSSNERYTDKIMCIPIKKNNIKKLNRKRLCDSLKILNRNTFEKIKKIRENTKHTDFATGRRIGFYSQLYINSKIAIELLE